MKVIIKTEAWKQLSHSACSVILTCSFSDVFVYNLWFLLIICVNVVSCRVTLSSLWNIFLSKYTGTGIFGLAVSVWPVRSGLFGHGTFRSDYETLQKFYINAKSSRLIQSALPHHHRLPKVEASTQSVLPSRFATAASAAGKVFYSA